MPRNPDVYSLGQSIEDPKTREAVQQLERLIRSLLDRATDTENSSVTLPIAESDVTGLVTDLAGKSAVGHTHAESDVTNLVSDLAGKSNVGHTHAESDVTGLVADLAAKAPLSHTHAESDITNLVSDLAAKVPTSRTLTGTAPIRVDGGASGDLSANRTISINTYAGSTAGAVPAATGDGTNFLREDGTWTSIAANASSPFYGPGTDGPLTFNGSSAVTLSNFVTVTTLTPSSNVYTLTRDIYATSMTVNSGVTIKTNGYRIFCTGTLTNNGTIHNNGGNASGSSGGTAAGAGTIPGAASAGANGATGSSGGAASAASTVAPPTPWTSTVGVASGGASGSAAATAGQDHFQGGGGGGVTSSSNGNTVGGNAGAITAYGATQPFDVITQVLGANMHGTPVVFTLGTGGGGGGVSILGGGYNSGGTDDGLPDPTSGGGGGGAGCVYIGAKAIAGTGTISANGGNGGNGSSVAGAAGGGGGGGGGLVVLVYSTCANTQTVTATGGTGGTKQAVNSYNFLGSPVTFTAANGANGYDGWVFRYQVTGTAASGGGGSLSDADYGDITVTSGGSVMTIDNNVVSFAKMADLATDTLVGRDTAGTGDPEAISVGGGLEFTGSGGIRRSALTGDVTASAGSNTTAIAANAVTLAQMATLATQRFLGRTTAGTGNVEALTGTQATALLDLATASAKGLCPILSGNSTDALRGDGTWGAVSSSGGGGSVFSGCSVYNSGNQSIANSTETAITYDTEIYDTDGYHSTTSNTSRMTAPVAGYYLLTAGVNFAANSTGHRALTFRKNGSTYLAFTNRAATASPDTSAVIIDGVALLAAGDYVEVMATQSSGGALNAVGNTYNTFTMTKVAGIAGSGVIACQVYNSTTQSIANATNTAVTYDTEVYDTTSLHSTSSNTSRITVPVAGYYLITTSAEFVTNSTGMRYLKIRKNGATEYSLVTQKGVVTYTSAMNSCVILSLAANDYVETVVYQDSGGALNINGRSDLSMSVALLQPTNTTPTFSGASVYNSATQSLSNTTYAALTYDTEEYDTDAYHSTVSNTSRFTIPAAGYYRVTGSINFASNSTGYRIAELYKNGTTRVAIVVVPPVSSDATITQVTRDIYLVAGDYIELRGWQSSGGNLNVTKDAATGSFQIAKIGL